MKYFFLVESLGRAKPNPPAASGAASRESARFFSVSGSPASCKFADRWKSVRIRL